MRVGVIVLSPIFTLL